jgi:hypothetical protein
VKTSLFVLILCVGCAVKRRPEVVVLPASPQGPWLALRDAIVGCGAHHGIAGEVHVRISVDPDGGPGSVSSDQGDAFSICIGRSIARWRYHAYSERVMDVPFVL